MEDGSTFPGLISPNLIFDIKQKGQPAITQERNSDFPRKIYVRDNLANFHRNFEHYVMNPNGR